MAQKTNSALETTMDSKARLWKNWMYMWLVDYEGGSVIDQIS